MITEIFKEKIIIEFGEEGKIWLGCLPVILSRISANYQLSNIKSFDNLSYNYVAKAYSKKYKSNLVIKIGCYQSQIDAEANALIAYNGKSCVKLIDHDSKNSAILVELIEPGNSLKNMFKSSEDESINICANIIRRLHESNIPDKKFPTIGMILKDLFEDNANMDKQLLNKARVIATNLIESQGKQILLHGDLHHENIIKSQDNWIAIDPKGLIGEAEYEIGCFIRNPINELTDSKDMKKIIENRIRKFSNILNYDEKRIIAWNYVQAILAACWAGDDVTMSNKLQKIARSIID